MKKKNKKPDEGPSAERWMLSYADFMTLLMIFFVVMYAMSQVDQTKYNQLSQSLSIAMGGGKTVIGADNTSSVKDNVKEIQDIQQQNQSQGEAKVEANNLKQLKKQVDQYLNKNGLSNGVSTKVDERGLVVSINNTLFFDTGKAEIKPDIQTKLIGIGKIVNQLGNSIRVEGHTDNVPISNSSYQSNWQLSTIRASNVTQFLQDKVGVNPEKLTSVGYGQYRPVADNSTEANRAKNRRVDIIIESSKFNEIEHGSSNSSNTSQNQTQTLDQQKVQQSTKH
ncbi:chemotaxis protein MotB [Clostridium algifaecis]|uniref:Chemotaxis protein MotB n=1 Tax=Clostridium algifaecis TaxID=1472040 RepID=A0ABS4KQI1_9CLOT|nr:flagellar motor protein MotB [Clostridium algifaecis]MBP2032293.1 chemotaxis protein MotB [Clostridium algifaecis]